ncbi:glycerol-3-phosphate dehydrogenase [Aestuariivirga litoralis]|uniref:Glycerol-3-phosphate dehydrogenase n=1 Tax=Aestuariivirga litoralis TaxID=2650924 RepID=A0A2W2AP08_9HYPH|nr:glycerol-3-phosphate dehydrogenase [Aestuariivirga litoralis]PZF75312.1 glycerol-3-phosphate dehydrogenase [Aestuariivirga litoralis]
MSTITILGAGVMGSAMCLPARDCGHAVRLVGTHLDTEIIDSVKATGRHLKLNVRLPDGVTGYQHDEFAKALGTDTDLLLLGISSAGVAWAIDRLCETLKAPVPVVMITKGMHPEESRLTALPDRVASEVKRRTGLDLRLAAIGGPCIAGELAVRRQTGTVITAHDLPFAQSLCDMLETDYYHPRLSGDVIGVEICAAFKNFFAIGVGWAAGHLEKMAATENRAFNHNAAAIIFDQAIRELMVLVRAHGGTEQSVWGMPGAGDLYVTAQAGRNSRLGNNLGRGLTYRQTKDGPMKGDTIEGAELGVTVAKTLRAMMKAGTLDAKALPLTNALLDALTNDSALDIPWAQFHRM